MRVLQSFTAPRPTTNPYLIMLGDSLRSVPGTEVITFTWRGALLGRYDVFHAHWPEILVDGHSPIKKLVRQMFTLLLLAKLRLSRIPIVRTMHNLQLPTGISRREVWLLRLIEKQTTLRIRLNTTTPIAENAPFVTIPHGHYRDWFASYPRSEVVRGRLGYFGLIRRYKGVESLIEAFGTTRDAAPELSLKVGGKPSTDELAKLLRRLADNDSRIGLHLEFLSDAELVEVATESELVVLPYRFMHNSGGTLAALSLDRPVLVPDNEVNRLLSEEVGPGWLYRFDGEITGQKILKTIAVLATQNRGVHPNLNGREWARVGAEHVAAYREAISIRHVPRPARASRRRAG